MCNGLPSVRPRQGLQIVKILMSKSNQDSESIPKSAFLSGKVLKHWKETIESACNECSVKTVPQSRLGTYLKYIDQLIKKLEDVGSGKLSSGEKCKLPYPWEESHIVHRGLVEINQLAYTITQVRKHDHIGNWKAKFREIASGHLLPETATHDPGRDAQFELFLSAYLISFGFQVTLRDPPGPDISVIGMPEGNVVEAKRVSSQNQLATRVKKASKQLASVGQKGVIALDVSMLAAGHGAAVVVPNVANAGHLICDLLGHNYTTDHIHEILVSIDDTCVEMVLIHILFLLVDKDTGMPSECDYWRKLYLRETADKYFPKLRGQQKF